MLTYSAKSRPARGEWIEIISRSVMAFAAFRLAPRGASGLKYRQAVNQRHAVKSRPARGEWIEIRCAGEPRAGIGLSRPARGEWIEISMRLYASRAARSRPARGEWIEIMPGPYWSRGP